VAAFVFYLKLSRVDYQGTGNSGLNMSNRVTTDINKNESAEPRMKAETYRAIMRPYKEPEDNHQVTLGLHVRLPFSSEGYAVCLLPEMSNRSKETIPGTGYCDGNHYGERLNHPHSTPLTTQFWQTHTSKMAWNEHVERLRMKEAESIRITVSPYVPHVCGMCKDMNPSKRDCKLPEQSMGSLCSLHERHRGLIILPANMRALRNRPYYGSLRQRLDKLEKKNRPAKIWRKSTLPTFNRNDGELDFRATMKAGHRVYKDVDPRLVPEVAYSHDRTEDSSGYDECAFPDDWRGELAESSGNGNGNDDHLYIDGPDSDVKSQVLEAPKPVWVSVTRKYFDSRRRLFVGFKTHFVDNERTELVRVWKPVDKIFPECMWHLWKPEVPAFMFTVEERKSVVRVRHDQVITRAEEYPTLINVNTPEMFAKDVKQLAKMSSRSEDELQCEGTVLIRSSTVVTKKERKYYSARREMERQKRVLTGYLISKDVAEGKAIPKHKWPVRSKRPAAPVAAMAAAGV
jgi:hypothetical protein